MTETLIKDVRERIDQLSIFSGGDYKTFSDLLRRCLSALEQAEGEKAELREALKPFGANPDLDDSTRVVMLAEGGPRFEFCLGFAQEFQISDVRRARSLTEGE